MEAGSGKEEMLTTQGVFCHAQTQRLQSGIDLQVRPRDRAVWVGKKRVEAVRTRLGWRVKLGRQRTRWAGIEGRLRGMSGKGREGETEHKRHAHTQMESVTGQR